METSSRTLITSLVGCYEFPGVFKYFFVVVCVCTALLGTGITLGAAAHGKCVSVSTRVCPRRMKGDGHVLCHKRVALRLRGR